jgi:hypothetical protein
MQQQEGTHHANRDDPGSLEHAAQRGADLQRLSERFDSQVDEQSHRRGHQEEHRAWPQAPQRREPAHPQQYRNDTDIDADERETPERSRRGGRGHRSDGDRRREGDAAGREEGDLIRLAGDPGIVQRHGRGAETVNGRAGRHRVGPDRVVHVDLRDRDLLLAGIAQLQLDRAGTQDGLLELERFRWRGRRDVEAGATGPDEKSDNRRQRQNWRQEDQRCTPA